MSLVGDVCAGDMPKMRGCKEYVAACGIVRSGINLPSDLTSLLSNTSVAQCRESAPIPGLPSTMTANNQIKSICTEMDMDGCDKCKINPAVSTTFYDCDILAVYADLCKAMPDMHQCGEWKTLCSGSPDLPYCSSAATDTSAPPAMKMFFHFGINEYVLFKELVPRSNIQYLACCLLCFVAAFVYEALLAWAAISESKWIKNNKAAACFPATLKEASCCGSTSKNPKQLPLPATTKTSWVVQGSSIALQRAAFKFVNATIGYAVMLVTMTFNVGLYFSTVLGLAVGVFYFGGFVKRAAIESGSVDQSSPTGCSCCA